MRETEGLDVAVLLTGEQDVETRKLPGDTPAAAERQAVRHVPAEVQTGRQRLQIPVLRPFDEGPLAPQAEASFQAFPGEFLFHVYGQIVHVRIVRIRPRPVAVGGQVRVLVVLAGPHVAVGLPLHAGLQDALHGAEMVQPVVLERRRVIKFAGVRDAVRIKGKRQRRGQEIALLLRVYGRLRRAVGVVQVLVRPVVVVIDRSLQT